MGLGTHSNFEEAAKWYKKSAKQGRKEAQFALFDYYAGQFGNFEKGFKWLKRAANQGHAFAQYTLARHYLSVDTTVPHSEEKGMYYLERAAVNGNTNAQDMISELRGSEVFLGLLGSVK